MSDGTKTWADMVAEFDAAIANRPTTLPVAVHCADPNPWDSGIRCELPAGHRNAHRAAAGLGGPERWTDRCHYPGDDREPCANPYGWDAA